MSCVSPSQINFALLNESLLFPTTWLEQQSEVDRASVSPKRTYTVTIRLDFSLYPRAPKAARCTAQSPLLTMDVSQVFHDDIFDGFPRKRFGADDACESICSPPQPSDLYIGQPDTAQGTTPEQWSSAAAAKPCEGVDFATDTRMALIAHTGGAEVANECLFEHVPLFERVPRLPPFYPQAHVVEQAEPGQVVAGVSPKGSSAAEEVRSCASGVVCLPKPWCTCKWEWLPDDDEGEATTSTAKPSGTRTWERLPDDLPEDTTEVNSTNKRKRGSDQGEGKAPHETLALMDWSLPNMDRVNHV
jgi:hypothetical protein